MVKNKLLKNHNIRWWLMITSLEVKKKMNCRQECQTERRSKQQLSLSATTSDNYSIWHRCFDDTLSFADNSPDNGHSLDTDNSNVIVITPLITQLQKKFGRCLPLSNNIAYLLLLLHQEMTSHLSMNSKSPH